MLSLSPTARFIIGLCITAAIGISQGTVSLAHAVPAEWISAIEAWCGIVAFIGSAAQTGLQGLGMTTASKEAVASSLPTESKAAIAAADPAIKKIETTPEIANSDAFAANPKVVSEPPK